MCRQLQDIPVHTTEGVQACHRTGQMGHTRNSTAWASLSKRAETSYYD
jgi:hypothetical protein